MFSKTRATIGIAATLLARDRLRTTLAVMGVILAVLSTTLLASVGIGVVATGQQKFDDAGRDLWLTGGPTRIQPGTLGGFDAGIVDAHDLSADIEEHPGVTTAVPMLFQTVYVGTTNNSLQPVVAVGLPSSGGVNIRSGEGFGRDAEYYADGAYNGTPTRNAVAGTRLADSLDLTVGESVHVGGTIVGARETTYEVVGTSSTFSQFLGTSTIAVPLAELQAMTGSAYADSATLVTIDVASNANVSQVKQRLESDYPRYTVRTNEEQLQKILAGRILIIAAGVALVAVAVLSGFALTANLLALLVVQQREVLAALHALGIPRRRLIALVVTQGLLLGVLGGTIGVILTPVAGEAVNQIAYTVTGLSGLVQTPDVVLAGGAVLAGLVGVVSAAIAGRQVARIEPLDVLER